jgi:branched-chain amino acid transport system substrate-binding protein
MRKIKASFLLFFISITFSLLNSAEQSGESKSKQIGNKEKNTIVKVDPDKEVVFGQSATLSGDFGLYGNIIKDAIEACFASANAKGGVKGRKLRLVSLDDEGNPAKSQRNINYMLQQGIDMFIGNMGTRSILKVLPQIKNKKIAMFFPWSGSDQLRDPQLSHIINGPGLLQPQLAKIVDYIESNIKHSRIGVFHADGSFSTNAKDLLLKEFKKVDTKPVGVESYNRLTVDMISSSNKMINIDPKIIIFLGTSKPMVNLINLFFEKGHYDTTFIGIDSTLFVGEILKHKGASFLYSSAVPNPVTSTMDIAKQYLKDMKVYTNNDIPNILSFTYYISASIVIDAIKSSNGVITKQKIINEVEKMKNYNLGGFTINFDSSSRHAYGNDISIIKG